MTTVDRWLLYTVTTVDRWLLYTVTTIDRWLLYTVTTVDRWLLYTVTTVDRWPCKHHIHHCTSCALQTSRIPCTSAPYNTIV